MTKKLGEIVPKILLRRYTDTGLFWYVLGVKASNPNISFSKAMDGFRRQLNIDYCDLTDESAVKCFSRQQTELKDYISQINKHKEYEKRS